MIKGYKCEHCTKFSEDLKKIKVHERGCVFDELRKHCFTCEHHSEGYPFGGFECEADQENSFSYYKRDLKDCPKWTAGDC